MILAAFAYVFTVLVLAKLLGDTQKLKHILRDASAYRTRLESAVHFRPK